MNAFRDEDLAGSSGDGEGHQDRFGHGAAAIVETGVRHFHAGELTDKSLVFEKCLQTAWTGFRLVGSVGRVIFTAAGHGVHDSRDEMIVTAAAQKTDCVA